MSGAIWSPPQSQPSFNFFGHKKSIGQDPDSLTRLVGPLVAATGHATDSLHTGDEQHRKKVQPTVRLFDCDLGRISIRGQDELRMIDTILCAVGHSDNEGLKRTCSEQLPDTCFHVLRN